MKTILFDSRWIGPHGIGRVAAEYLNRLKRDYRVVEYTASEKPSAPLDFVGLGSFALRLRPDVIISPGYNGVPCWPSDQIIFVHDLIHMKPQQPGGSRRRLYLSALLRTLPSRTKVVTVSAYSQNEILKRFPFLRGRVHVIPNGIASEFAHCPDEPGAARSGVLLFGNDRWHKNLDGMIRAIARAAREGEDVFPVRVVNSRERSFGLFGELSELGPVIHLKTLSDFQLSAAYRSSKAFLFCSFEEGFGLPILESVASGCPVVASDLEVFRELGVRNCFFVSPHDSTSIVTGLRAAIAKARDLNESYERPELHSWDHSYAALKELIESAP